MDSLETYHPKRHSASRTTDYLFAQLIPYLGNKRKLLPIIQEAVARTGVRNGNFCDFFAGSGVVARWAKMNGFRVIANDWEPYAQVINACYLGLNAPPPGGPALIETLNSLPSAPDGYLQRHYCPAEDLNPDPERERCFYTRANGSKLDAMRQQIAEWEESGQLTLEMQSYLIAPMLYAASYVSNTSGVFKAYHSGWGGQTKTALYRILSEIALMPPILWDNGARNLVFQADAQKLATHWGDLVGEPLDIAYLDPPYNQHPYGSNYHLLNTIALWDKPDVPPIARGFKSAIRTDWRTARRSAYNQAAHALGALTALVDAIPARWVLLSYSTDGNMPIGDLLQTMAARGATEIIPRRYKRYRVSTPRMSLQPHTTEFVLVLDKQAKPDPEALFRMLTDLQKSEDA